MSFQRCLFQWRLKPELHNPWHQAKDDAWTDFCQCRNEKDVRKWNCQAHERKLAKAYIEKMKREQICLFEFRWKEPNAGR